MKKRDLAWNPFFKDGSPSVNGSFFQLFMGYLENIRAIKSTGDYLFKFLIS